MMSKYYDMNNLPTGQVEYKVRFEDGYVAVFIQYNNNPPYVLDNIFKDTAVRHGNPIKIKSMKITNPNELSRMIKEELNKRYECKKIKET